MINLGFCNVVTNIGQPDWRQEAKRAGLNPAELRCVTWHWTTDDVKQNAVAWFRVRPGDPGNYIVPR